MNRPLIVAHAGGELDAPENTLPAFENAIALGADVIEFDVNQTADDEIAVHHDYCLGRTNDGSGFIGDYTLAELRQLDAGSWYDARFAGTRIPTLAQVLDLGKGKIRFLIDIKTPDLGFLQRVYAEIARFGVEGDVAITSPHVPLVCRTKMLYPKLQTNLCFQPWPDWVPEKVGQQDIIGWMKLADAQIACLKPEVADGTLVDRLHSEGFQAAAIGVNTEEQVRWAMDLGFDLFGTDRLDLTIPIHDALTARTS